MARKGRRRRYQEARDLKHGFDDGLFAEGAGTLADSHRGDAEESTTPGAEGGRDVLESDGWPDDSAPR